ncbi:YxiJ-like family protein [Bacillus cereus group sp. MYBK30-1]|uniref:YxiJ-like family protein n=1 Tax=unclassified Bacillus cereus group TaxID=2750818 RepID=UPI003F792713
MHSPLHKSFPYRDTRKLRRDFKCKFTEIDDISADLNHYWMHKAAILNSILNENEENITFQQIKWLRKSFFEWFPQYRFLETEIVKYSILYKDFMNYEKARKLLLYYLTE